MGEIKMLESEHRAMDLIGQAAAIMLGWAEAGSPDAVEIAHRVHALQDLVLARAACRAYPERYRMLGSD